MIFVCVKGYHILQKGECDMSKANVSSSGSRILRVLKALRGHAERVSNGELASALGESPANINRALNTLIEEGLALKLENGRFAPGVQLLQIAMAHNNEMSRAQGRIDELNQRVLAGSR
jgi:DNA-binding IclR family transcriptional regulator